MNIRIHFEKTSTMAYLGHLDLMRYFQKALRRADFPLAFTKGFHPHPIMTFGAPLSVGVESSGEYFDISLSCDMDLDSAMMNLNKQMVEGIHVLNIIKLPEKTKNAMACVTGASYNVYYTKGYNEKLMADGIKEFLSKDSIIFERQTKKNVLETDIKPLIYEMSLGKDEIGSYVYLLISQGSENNVPPIPVIRLLSESMGEDFPDIKIFRKETYMTRDDKLVPLDSF